MESQSTKEKFLGYTSSEVDALLKAYEEYKSLAAQIASETNPSAATKFSFGSSPGRMQNLDPKKNLRKELERVAESMKFQNPLIWLDYKRFAYANEPGKELKTLSDLITHCEVDGICHRRFDAINLYLRRMHNGKDMRSASFMSRETTLENVGQDARFLDMCLDQEFAEMWKDYENSKSGKWRDYTLTSPDHDCEVNCTC